MLLFAARELRWGAVVLRSVANQPQRRLVASDYVSKAQAICWPVKNQRDDCSMRALQLETIQLACNKVLILSTISV